MMIVYELVSLSRKYLIGLGVGGSSGTVHFPFDSFAIGTRY